MDSLVHKASEELGERLSVDSVTKSVVMSCCSLCYTY